LADALSALSVQLTSQCVEPSAVPLPDYLGGPRPSSVVRLAGAGHFGSGENVAFFQADHERFAALARGWLTSLRGGRPLTVASALTAFAGTGYERAALEAALIDLGLRQAGLSLHDLTGVREARLGVVVSLAADTAPERALDERRRAGYMGPFKLDVSPAWSEAKLTALALDSSIAIFDFKGRGEVAAAQLLADQSATALLEDPPSGFRASAAGRISRDAGVTNRFRVGAARAKGEAVNLKAPRMGGPLELLRGLELAFTSGNAPIYFGGMFEVGVGRSQARQLAALYCPNGPNDLAANTVERRVENPPLVIPLDHPGFGAATRAAPS
jgi:L-alanine-DL-glutamate epimerase-like enolase superfamily enzyme